MTGGTVSINGGGASRTRGGGEGGGGSGGGGDGERKRFMKLAKWVDSARSVCKGSVKLLPT